jgi:hypothetical protein
MMSKSNDIEKHPFQQTTIFYLARGPIILVAVIVSILIPHIKEYFTLYVFLHLATASLGLVWIYRDLSTLIQSAIRSGLNLVFDKIVLDDLLRTIYDPIDGLWACTVGTYLGASSMYGLRMTEGQRTELIQSSLGLRDESQAHTVLLEPGGCKALFPMDIQKWLQSSRNDQQHEGNYSARVAANHSSNNVIDSSSSWSVHQSMGGTVGLESDKSGSDDDDTEEMNSHDTHISDESSSENDEQNVFSCPADKLNSFEDEIIGRLPEPISTQERRDQADPLAVFFRIIQKMGQKKLKTYAEAVPRSKIENIGIASAAAFGIQLALRRSHKKSHFIEHVCASIATISFGTILAREAFLGNIHDKQTMQIVCKDLASSILNKIKEKSASNKSLFAMIVLVIFCRREQVTKGIPAKDNFIKR